MRPLILFKCAVTWKRGEWKLDLQHGVQIKSVPAAKQVVQEVQQLSSRNRRLAAGKGLEVRRFRVSIVNSAGLAFKCKSELPPPAICSRSISAYRREEIYVQLPGFQEVKATEQQPLDIFT